MKKLLLAACMTVLLILGITVGAVSAKADDLVPVDASAGLNLYTLAEGGYLKLTGRAIANSEGYIETDFSSCGFEVIINAPAATDLTLTYSSYSGGAAPDRVTFYVDETEYTSMVSKGDGRQVTIQVPAGQHTLRVIKDSIIEMVRQDYARMDSIKFNGTVVGPAPDKPLYFIHIGASGQCGAHADFPYWPGTVGQSQNHFVTKSAPFTIAKLLNADVNVVAQGGIGLRMTDAQEPIEGKVTMQVLYPYSSYRKMDIDEPYDFTKERKPDFIIITLSGNDSNAENQLGLWVAEAKKFILYVKEKHGQDVPIVWSFGEGRDVLFRGFRDLVENDPEISAYGDIYMTTLLQQGNGGAAKDYQEYGHPDAKEYQAQGESLYHFIITEGVIADKLKQIEATTDYTYYVTEGGNDENDGLSPESALETVATVLEKLPASLPNDALLTIKVSGTVVQSATVDLFGGVIKYRNDGTKLPIVVETLNYDGTAKSTVQIPYAPADASSTAIVSANDVTFRNVTLQGTGVNGSYTVDRFHADGAVVTFDNVDWIGANSTKLSVYANPLNLRAEYSNITGSGQVTSEIVFKNGVYDSTTGFATIAAIGGNGYLLNGTAKVYSVPGLTSRILIAEGAWLNEAKIMTSFALTKFGKAEVEVTTKGTLDSRTSAYGYYAGTPNGTSGSRNVINGNPSFKITGGHLIGGFAQFGDYVTVNGTVYFTMDGGEIYVPEGAAEINNSIFISGAYQSTIVNGNVENYIHGGRFHLKAGNNVPTAILFGGRNAVTITGTLHNTVKGSAHFLITKEPGTTVHASSGLWFGPNDGAIQTELRTDFEEGIVCFGQLNGYLSFGTRGTSAIKKLTNIIGVPDGDRVVGPDINAYMILLGGRYNQLGVSTRSTAAVPETPISDVVLTNTIYGIRVDRGSVNFNTFNADYSTRVMGSIENTIHTGYFRVNGLRLEAVHCPIYGHVKNVINGGLFKGIAVSVTKGVIYGGLEYIINDYHDYSRATGATYAVNFSNADNVRGTDTVPALSVTINGGAFYGTVRPYNSKATYTGDVVFQINGGYFLRVDGRDETGFINEGHFVEQPDASYVVAGKAALAGIFKDTDQPKNIVEYHYEIGDPANSIIVEVSSQSTRGDVSFADLQGGGVYKKGSKYTITAPDIENFKFLGWYTPDGARASKSKTYSGTAKSDVTRIAKYELIDNLAILKVTADAFELTANGETTDETGTITKYLPAGTVVSLKYTDGTKPFIAWLNGSDKIIGTNGNNYSFTLCVDSEIKASTSEAGAFDVLVMFENEYNQLLSTQYVEQGAAAIEMPTPPQRLGRTLGWDKDAAAILAEIQGGADTVTVKAIVTARTDDTYTVNVKHVLEGAEGTEISENVVSAKVGAGVLVEAPEELSGKPFMYVKLGDEIISYERTFPFKANADTILTAVYGDSAVEKAPLVTMTIAHRRDNGTTDFATFTALRVIPEDCEVISQGILVTQDASIGGKASAFIYGANGVKTAVAKDTTKADITTVNMQKAPKDATVYGRAFVVIRNGNGEQSTIYSEIAVLAP